MWSKPSRPGGEARTLGLAWLVSVLALAAAGRFGRRAALRGSTSGLAASGIAAAVGAITAPPGAVPPATAAAVAFTVG
ncbi:MAG: hypothetical protein KY439_01565, partial [Actinobacteria bacterium]|nr:hypothetical protein [Actinomycetota bacterium]